MKNVSRWFRWLGRGVSILRTNARFAAERILGRRILLWEIHFPAQMDYVRPVLENLSQNKRIKSYFVSLPYDSPIAGPKQTINVFDLKYAIPIDLFISLSQYTNGIPPNARQSLLIPHGLPSKGNSIIDTTMQFDHFFLTGPLLRDLFQSFVQSHSTPSAKPRLHEAGYPRSDPLFLNKTKSTKEAGSTPPSVLFAPSFEPRTCLDTYGYEPIDRLLALPIRLLIKLHPMCYQPHWQKKSGHDWPLELKQRYSSRGNVTLVEGNSLDSLIQADALVTDVSGIALEYILADRGPVVYLNCPDFYRITLPEMFGVIWENAEKDEHVNVGRHTGLATGVNGLADAIRFVLAHPAWQRDLRQQFVSRLVYHPGQATARYIELIMEILAKANG
jgi:hypothetical protein